MGYFETAAKLREKYDLGKIKRAAGEDIGSDPGYAQYAQQSNRAYDAAARGRKQNLGARGLLGSGVELRGEQVASQNQISQMGQAKAQRMLQLVTERKDEIMNQLKMNEDEYKLMLQQLAVDAGLQEWELNRGNTDDGSRWAQGIGSAITGIAGAATRKAGATPAAG